MPYGLDLEELAKQVGAVVAIAGAALAAFRLGRWGARRAWANARAVTRFVDRLQRAVDEILPNGGGSLSDAVRRLETGMGEVRELVQLQARLSAVNANRWRALHQDEPNGIADFDEQGRLSWANRTFLLGMVGRELAELRGHGWVLALAPEMREDVWEDWTAAVRQHRDFERLVEFERPRDLARFRAHMRAACILDERGELAGMTAIITARPAAPAERRA